MTISNMGLKLFNIHNIVSWSCFHLVKNSPVAGGGGGDIKLIKSDGAVQIYHRPINVSDLLSEFPKHLVCRSDSFFIGRKILPLSEHDHLQLGHEYFLLPQKFFNSDLSFVAAASFLNAAAATAGHCPFDIQKTPSGCLQIRISDEFISRLLEQGTPKIHPPPPPGPLIAGKICTTPQLAKDYTHLVTKRQWKPKLEPIMECSKKGISAFGFKKGKIFRSDLNLISPPPPPLPPVQHLRLVQFGYKPKIRAKLRALSN